MFSTRSGPSGTWSNITWCARSGSGNHTCRDLLFFFLLTYSFTARFWPRIPHYPPESVPLHYCIAPHNNEELGATSQIPYLPILYFSKKLASNIPLCRQPWGTVRASWMLNPSPQGGRCLPWGYWQDNTAVLMQLPLTPPIPPLWTATPHVCLVSALVCLTGRKSVVCLVGIRKSHTWCIACFTSSITYSHLTSLIVWWSCTVLKYPATDQLAPIYLPMNFSGPRSAVRNGQVDRSATDPVPGKCWRVRTFLKIPSWHLPSPLLKQ